MKFPADRSWSVMLVFAVTYAIALGVLLIGRNAGETAAMHQAPVMPAGPRRLNPQGPPLPGSRARPMNPAQNDSN
jgi:hypothetical protein